MFACHLHFIFLYLQQQKIPQISLLTLLLCISYLVYDYVKHKPKPTIPSYEGHAYTEAILELHDKGKINEDETKEYLGREYNPKCQKFFKFLSMLRKPQLSDRSQTPPKRFEEEEVNSLICFGKITKSTGKFTEKRGKDI